MNAESNASDIEKHENVKERLNNLLHKKILDQHERSGTEISNKSNDSIDEKSRNVDVIYQQQGESSNEPFVEITEESELTNVSDEDSSKLLLHHILNEKKKALLRNKDVMHFLQNKLKYN